MQKVKNFVAPQIHGGLGLDWDILFDGGSYHLIENEDYNVPAGVTGAELTAARNKIIFSIKSKGKRLGKDAKCYKVGAPQQMDPGIVVVATEATDEQKAEWEAQYEKVKQTWKDNLAAKKAAKTAGQGPDSTAAAAVRENGSAPAKPVAPKPQAVAPVKRK